METNKVDFGKLFDQHVNMRDVSEVNLNLAKLEILKMGGKVFEDGSVKFMPGLNLKKYLEQENQEFSWEADLEEDDKPLRQFEKKKQHHYAHIDQDRLLRFRWVSCFDYPVAPEVKEKNVEVELDFKNIDFKFQNGFISPEVRNKVWEFKESIKGKDFQPRLIMKAIKRQSSSFRMGDEKASRITLYYRYLIGVENIHENGEKEKLILCIEPNGTVHVWDK